MPAPMPRVDLADRVIPDEAKALDKDAARQHSSLLQQINDRDIVLSELAGAYPPSFIAALEHSVSQVRAAKLAHRPFPHMIIDGFLPNQFFDTLVALMPSLPAMRKVSRNRHELRLTPCDGAFNLLRPAQVTAWSFYADVLFRFGVLPALVERLGKGLADWYATISGGAIEEPIYTPHNQRLIWSGPGYSLDPHIDVPVMGLVCLTYFTPTAPIDAEAAEVFGTQIYEAHGSTPNLSPGQTHYARGNLTLGDAVSVPFAPNRMLVFLNGASSYHGAGIPKDERFKEGRTIAQIQVGLTLEQRQQIMTNSSVSPEPPSLPQSPVR